MPKRNWVVKALRRLHSSVWRKASRPYDRNNQLYYVYIAKINECVVYVGKGKGKRSDHINSGTSSCYAANKSHFSGISAVVERINCGMTARDALELELLLIKELRPPWNIDGHGPNLNDCKSKRSTSVYLGVSRISGNSRWRAWYRDGVKKVHTGNYASEEEAAKARDEYMRRAGLPCHFNADLKGI